MVVKTAEAYMAGEFINRIRYLQKALNQAEQIINTLETENNRLKDVLSGLTSENKEDHMLNSESFNEPVWSV